MSAEREVYPAASMSFIFTEVSKNKTYTTVCLGLSFLYSFAVRKSRRKSIKERLGGGGRWAGTDWRPHGETRLCRYHSNSETLTSVIRNTCGCLEENILYNEFSVCVCVC